MLAAPVCAACERGRVHLEALGVSGALLQAAASRLRSLSAERRPAIDEELTPDELRAIDQLADERGRQALEDVSALICEGSDPCTVEVLELLRCVVDNCRELGGPVREDDYALPTSRPDTCDPYVVIVRSPRTGFGAELVTGWHDSAAPSDGRAWGFGIEARRRLTNRFGVVARIDHTRGRDAGEDVDGDGRDDVATGSIHRWWGLAGPSVLLTSTPRKGITRMVELDLLLGGVATTSQPGEDGLVAGADLSYRIAILRFGLRALQGMGDAGDAQIVLAHFGFTVGAAPSLSYGAGCASVERSAVMTRWALALDIPLSGYSAGTGLGYMAPGFAIEGAYHLHHRFDALVRGDLLVFPNGDADRVLQQGLLAGARLDLSRHKDVGTRTGLFLAVVAGYGLASATEPTRAGSGPVVDASIGWGGQGDDGAGWLRLHGRFGLTDDNADLRAIFLSAGLELRIDRRRWGDRL